MEDEGNMGKHEGKVRSTTSPSISPANTVINGKTHHSEKGMCIVSEVALAMPCSRCQQSLSKHVQCARLEDKVAAAIPSLKDVRERIQQLKTDRLVRQAKHQVAIRRFEEKVGYSLRKVKESVGCMKQVTTTLISFHLRCLLNMGCSTVLEHLTSPSWELLVAGRTCAIGLKMSPVDHHPPPYDCSIPQQRAEGMWLSAHTARPEQTGNAVMSMFLDLWDPE